RVAGVFFFQAEDGIRDFHVTGVQTCALPICWVINGKVHMTFDVRFGSELTPTREGAFQVNFKSRDHVSSLYDTSMPYAMFFSGEIGRASCRGRVWRAGVAGS